MIQGLIGLFHTVAAAVALVAGAVVFFVPKAGMKHKAIGYVYSTAMIVVVVTAFLIYRLTGSFNILHLAAFVRAASLTDTQLSKRRRLSFSMLNLLLLTAVVALAITVSMLYQEVRPLRAEVERLRAEVGELHIEDPSDLHALQVETADELEWKWRIWIPEGASYHLRGYGGLVPKEGFPNEGGTIMLGEPGEHVVRYVIRRDPRDGKWNGSLRTDGASVGKDEQPWVQWTSHTSTTSGVGGQTRAYQPDTRIELIRFQASQAKSSTGIEDPAAGFMVWLEPM